MLDLSETCVMADDGASKRTVKINDFKAPEEWRDTPTWPTPTCARPWSPSPHPRFEILAKN
jgi:hypothetical protein